jgi:hypothetical protein
VKAKNARFLGVNILSELDTPQEYYIDAAALKLYFLPPPPQHGSGQSVQDSLVLSVAGSTLIDLADVKHVHLVNLTVAYGRRGGIAADQVENVVVANCSGACGWTNVSCHRDANDDSICCCVFQCSRAGQTGSSSTAPTPESLVTRRSKRFPLAACAHSVTVENRSVLIVPRDAKDKDDAGVLIMERVFLCDLQARLCTIPAAAGSRRRAETDAVCSQVSILQRRTQAVS